MIRLLPLLLLCPPLLASDPATSVEVRRRVAEAGKTDAPKLEQVAFAPSKAAIVICDMWDDHWCAAAAKRCDVLAKQAGPLVEAARKAGVTIIHCPSDTMEFYKDHPARRRTLELKKFDPPKNLDLPDPQLPIDDKAGGCDDAEPKKPFKAWKRQHAAIAIDGEKDFVTDKGGDVYNILRAKGLDRVFVLGVHTNMCVLHRTFAIKQLRRWNVECVLVRDLTDAMYDPRARPFVAHDAGTQLVVEFIERNWCPTVTREALAKALGR